MHKHLNIMKNACLWLIGVGGSLLMTVGCERKQELGPPKAEVVREDGVLELGLMSFNIRYETREDRDSRSWPERLAGVVAMIRRERPDVMGVQEALHGQAADLWASLPDYEFFGVGRDDGVSAGEYAGIFFRRDRFVIDPQERGTFWLSDTPEKPGSFSWGNEIPRVTTWVRLVDLATGRGFYVFNTHWDHRNQPSREKAAWMIARRVDGRIHKDEPVVLIGDLNTTETHPGYLYLTGKKVKVAGQEQRWSNAMIDTFQILNPSVKDRRTLHFWSGSRAGFLKVDHIFVSDGAEVLASGIISGDKTMVSDHFPVTSRVRFRQKP
jgi:endonuclease/exonuclease/phosphatase family metal-dependent hydrolase